MVRLFGNLFRPQAKAGGFAFSRPLVLLHSDDWGRVGVRDKKGYEQLRARGIRLGEHAYDLYTLETAEDVSELAALLARHHDSTGRQPCMAMNFCTANLNFNRMSAEGYKSVRLLPLSRGLPGRWSRPGLLDAYRGGVKEGLFYPALHGTSHACATALENALAANGERARLLHLIWEAETPFIFWRMPWVGYEYWNPEKPNAGFLPAETQRKLIKEASDNFVALFGRRPTSACAPGYRSNRDTERAWADAGIHVVASGTGSGLRPPRRDAFGLLHLYRTIDFEPSQRELDIDKYVEVAGACFVQGLPLIISTHSINFHSTLKDFRSSTLVALDHLLTALESRYPELLYVNDEDMYTIVTEGAFKSRAAEVNVFAYGRGLKARAAAAGAH